MGIMFQDEGTTAQPTVVAKILKNWNIKIFGFSTPVNLPEYGKSGLMSFRIFEDLS